MEPASIRFKNPGAMWGNALARKWGAEAKAVVLHDGLGQGNNIAVFPTYVAGICAQLDLWRTSKNYHNKRFEDAIRIWSGGNYASSYVQFVTSRVPGMTADTVMNDAFLGGPSSIEFLKAQAWREAGKKYPAPDSDFQEAHRRVFDRAAVAQPMPVPEPALPARDTAWLQRSLNTLGAAPPLVVDGIVGPKLRGAIQGYQQQHGLDVDGLIGPATLRQIDIDLAALKPTPAPPIAKVAALGPDFFEYLKGFFFKTKG